jgi:hypothetical protein
MRCDVRLCVPLLIVLRERRTGSRAATTPLGMCRSLCTDSNHVGHGMTITIGCGNDVVKFAFFDLDAIDEFICDRMRFYTVGLFKRSRKVAMDKEIESLFADMGIALAWDHNRGRPATSTLLWLHG